jgi:hypothetical protein
LKQPGHIKGTSARVCRSQGSAQHLRHSQVTRLQIGGGREDPLHLSAATRRNSGKENLGSELHQKIPCRVRNAESGYRRELAPPPKKRPTPVKRRPKLRQGSDCEPFRFLAHRLHLRKPPIFVGCGRNTGFSARSKRQLSASFGSLNNAKATWPTGSRTKALRHFAAHAPPGRNTLAGRNNSHEFSHH